MKVLIALEAHFLRTPDGLIWTESVPDNTFWERYLTVFNSVLVVARVKDVSSANPIWKRADCQRVKFCCLPDYIGPWQYFKSYRILKKLIINVVNEVDAAVLRVPGSIGTLIYKEVLKHNIAFALEVVGDPWDSLAPGTIKSVARPIARFYQTYSLKRQCRRSLAVSYVTEKQLQTRYPSKGFSTHYSSIRLSEEAILSRAPEIKESIDFRIINVGSMETLYKGQEVQIRALKRCRDLGHDVRLLLVGDGRCRPHFEKISLDLGVSEYVNFLGSLPGPEIVREELDRADIFILPSLVEGLPRALIEAMARGLPCIATDVGGIPELLPSEDMVKPGDYVELSNKIIEVISNNARMKEMAARNLHKAKEYKSSILDNRRIEFYLYLRNQAQMRRSNESLASFKDGNRRSMGL